MRAKTKPRRRTKNRATAPILLGDHLAIDPRVCHGEITFRGTRVPVATILRSLAMGYSHAYIRKSWPEVSAAAIVEAVSLASEHFLEHYRDKVS